MRLACAFAFLLETVISGSVPDSSGAAFGARRFLDLIPFAVVGMAAVAARLGSRFDWPAVGALCAWNLILIANFVYVIGPSGDPGYAALFLGQGAALPYVPRLFAKGAVVRDLLLWSQTHTRFDPAGGLSLFAAEAACLAAAMAATRWPRTAASATADSPVPRR